MADNKTLVFSDEHNNKIELATKMSVAERFAEIDKKIGNGLVPEESGTVSLGSEDKKYKEIYANKIIVDEIVGSDGEPIEMGGGNTYIINNLGYASRNHYYKKGEIIACQANETKVVYLTCKVSGTSSMSELNVSNAEVGDNINDGTAVWIVSAIYDSANEAGNNSSPLEQYIYIKEDHRDTLTPSYGRAIIIPEASTVLIAYQDPEDDGNVTYTGTVIVKKQGSYPENPNDGIIVSSCLKRNMFQLTNMRDIQSNPQEWFYRAFAIYNEGVWSSHEGGKIAKYLGDAEGIYSYSRLDVGKGKTSLENVCGMATIAKNNKEALLKWTDPENDKWCSTVIVRKKGSYPIDLNDGIMIAQITDKNKFKGETEYLHDFIDNANQYFYSGFAVYEDGSYSTAGAGQFTVFDTSMNSSYHYACYIDQNDAVESTCVHPVEGYDNYNYEPIKMRFTSSTLDEANNNICDMGSWFNAAFLPKPCMLKHDGTVDYYLKTSDYTLKEDGTKSDVSNVNYDGEAMMEWSPIFIKVQNDTEKNRIYLYFCNAKFDSDYECYPCKNIDGSYADHFYTSIYPGSGTGTLRSFSGQTVTQINTPPKNFTISRWEDEDLFKALGVLVFGRLDSQKALGFGTKNNITGSTDKKGLFWGCSAEDNTGTKFFGMENMWGLHNRRIINAEIKTDNGLYVTNADSPYSKSLVGILPATNGSVNFLKGIHGLKHGIFTPKTVGGSSSTYYCDNGVPKIDALSVGNTTVNGGMFAFGNAAGTNSRLSYHINKTEIDLNNVLGTGKNLGTINNANEARDFVAVHMTSDGLFKDINVGDKITIKDGTYNKEWYVAGFDTELNVDHTLGSYGRHHIALVPVDMLLNAQMNSSDANSSGYNGSLMKTSTIKTIDTTLQKVLGDTLLPHKETLPTGSSSGVAQVEVYSIIMNEQQVFGSKNCDNYNGTADGDDNTQLPLFKLRAETKKIASNSYWWLRCPCSSAYFAGVGSGSPNYSYASYSYGVRPLILLG